jgi:hypothetical protein
MSITIININGETVIRKENVSTESELQQRLTHLKGKRGVILELIETYSNDLIEVTEEIQAIEKYFEP